MIGICISGRLYIGIKKKKRSSYSQVLLKSMNPTFDPDEYGENEEDELEIRSRYSEYSRDDERYILR